ncbi:DNA-binding response regulator [Glaciihabitans sp. dw_435]|uniref:response regulator transcription factor n=1 Tax=Glaciihabitans sp. dw_435 TaxID=2720081 RepID=UPI001BD64B11|nr:DNA-binding response regulator [Glaciihabitans sp. dw_435]
MTLAETSAEIVRPVTIAILDDHELLMDSISTWVATNATDFDVVLAAITWGDFVLSPHFPADLVFMDYHLQGSASIESRVRTCRAAGSKVIVLSGLDTRETRERSLNAGAARFISKALGMTDAMEIARDVMGLPQLAPEPAPELVEAPELIKPKLSAGETQALLLYASGFNLEDVAREMGVQYETAKTYIRRVREKYSKAGRAASRRIELIQRAAEDGYLN